MLKQLQGLSPGDFRLVIAGIVAAIFVLDLVSPPPWGVLYLVPIGLTFWSSDTWMPQATGWGCAACLGLVLLVEGNAEPPHWLLFNRIAGFVILLASGWLISEHQRVVAAGEQAARLARTSEERLNEAVEVARLGFFELDHSTELVRWSASAQRLLERDFGGPVTQDVTLSAVYPDDREALSQAVRRSCDPNGDGRFTLEHRVLTARGEVRHVSTSLATTFEVGPPRRPQRTVGTVVDVTGRKQLESQRDKLALQLLQVQENERQALARGLHEEVGQSLSVLRLNLLRIRRDPASAAAIADGSIEIVDEAVQGVRDVTLSLRPPVLDDLGLAEAIQWFVDRTATRSGIAFACDVDTALPRLSPATEIACFRVLQEAVSNMCRHSRTTRGAVRLTLQDGALELLVRDEGVGFDVEEATLAAGSGLSIGLASMGERVALLGGLLRVNSERGRGCEVLARFPAALQQAPFEVSA